MVPEQPLPDLHQATLSAEELAALLRDLRECAEVLSIRVRGAPPVGAPALALDDVPATLEGGAPVQVMYRFDGATWIDRLTRVVRIHRG